MDEEAKVPAQHAVAAPVQPVQVPPIVRINTVDVAVVLGLLPQLNTTLRQHEAVVVVNSSDHHEDLEEMVMPPPAVAALAVVVVASHRRGTPTPLADEQKVATEAAAVVAEAVRTRLVVAAAAPSQTEDAAQTMMVPSRRTARLVVVGRHPAPAFLVTVGVVGPAIAATSSMMAVPTPLTIHSRKETVSPVAVGNERVAVGVVTVSTVLNPVPTLLLAKESTVERAVVVAHNRAGAEALQGAVAAR